MQESFKILSAILTVEQGIKNLPIFSNGLSLWLQIPSKTGSRFGRLGGTHPPKTYSGTPPPGSQQRNWIHLHTHNALINVNLTKHWRRRKEEPDEGPLIKERLNQFNLPLFCESWLLCRHSIGLSLSFSSDNFTRCSAAASFLLPGMSCFPSKKEKFISLAITTLTYSL